MPEKLTDAEKQALLGTTLRAILPGGQERPVQVAASKIGSLAAVTVLHVGTAHWDWETVARVKSEGGTFKVNPADWFHY